MKTPLDFEKAVLGKRIDVDNAYGVQCWDGYAYYMQWLGMKPAYCTTSNYVKDIWNNRKTNRMLDQCFEVTEYQKGDIAIFKECKETPKSHIAIFMEDNGDGTGSFLGENQGGNREFRRINLHYSSLLGMLRPNCYKDLFKKTCPFKKKGTVEAIETNIRVRTVPSLIKGDTGKKYQPGEKLHYFDVVEADGWYWAKYHRLLNGATGIGYCALCKTDGTSKFWKQV